MRYYVLLYYLVPDYSNRRTTYRHEHTSSLKILVS